MTGRVRAIHLAPTQGAPVEAVESVEAVAGRGLRGDRYCDDDGTFGPEAGSDLTLVQGELVEAAEREFGLRLSEGRHRRNVTTAGISLENLVDERFRVGDAICRGTGPCDPCAYLEEHLGQPGVREALVDRGGLRARILDGGTITVGDSVEPLSQE